MQRIEKPTLARVTTTNGGDAVVLVHYWDGPTYGMLAEALNVHGEPCGRTHWILSSRIKSVDPLGTTCLDCANDPEGMCPNCDAKADAENAAVWAQ